MATETRARPEGEAAEPKRRFKFPTAFTVLFFVLVLVLTFIIKPGTYSYVSCDGGSPKPIPGTFENFDQNLSFQERLYDLWLSPVNGLYGIRTPAETVAKPGSKLLTKAEAACGKVDGKQVPAEVVTPPGNTGPYNSGDLAGAVQVFFFVLAIGAFITVTIKTGALDADRAGHQQVPPARPAADRDLDGDLLPRRDHLRDGRGDAGLLCDHPAGH